MDTRKDIHYKKYCKLRNKVRSQVRLARKNYECTMNRNLKKNPKLFFRYISSKTSNIEKIGKLYSDPLDTSSRVTHDDMQKTEITTSFLVCSLMN